MDTTAFSRARSLLRYARPSCWTAILTGMATAFLYAFLVLLLALFIDLLTTRGRIPHFAQLSTHEQESTLQEWSSLPEAERVAALQHVGFADLQNPPSKTDPLPAESQARWKLFQALQGGNGTEYPPLPAKSGPKELLEWATKHQVPGDPYFQAVLEHEWRWKAYVWHILNSRVDEAAADRFQPTLDPKAPFALPGIGEDNRKSYGILGMVVRQRNTVWGRVAASSASGTGWTWEGEEPNRTYLTGLFILGIGLVLLRGLCLIVMNEAAARASLEVVTRLRRSIYHHTARQGALTAKTGSLDEAGVLFTREVERVHEAILFSLSYSYRYAVFFPLMLLIALIAHFWLSIAFVLLAIIVWALVGQMTTSFKRQGRVATRLATNRLELLLESLRQMRLVKSYRMELFNQSRVERQLADYSNAHLRRIRGDAFVKPLRTTLAVLAGLTLFYLAGRVILNDGSSLAGFAVLTVSFLSLYFPVRSRLSGHRVLRHGRESAAAIFDYLDRRGDLITYPDADFLPGVSRGLEFADVTVREPETGRLLLDKINLKVKAGQRLGIVASDPDEQHILVSLIPRFLDPTEGEIKIDGRNLKWVTQDSLRTQIGLVLQGSLIFNDTVSNNIGCGDPSFTLPQIIEAAKLAHAHQFILRLPYGYETSIGELAHSLSSGEQFRIALARAILRDPAIFILEEPADHLDEDTKDLLDDTLNRVLPGKTVIYLPHRMSTLRECDKIVLLHEGRVVGAGEHRELMVDNELYRHLYYLEFNPFAEATA
ncbi:MAG: ABC transporter ATP-binding protein [Gemmataceae bacterium]|nr:ABC transporter ATP-binding protein [Gemmataceae bacterium]